VTNLMRFQAQSQVSVDLGTSKGFLKVRHVAMRWLERDGRVLVRTRGSHRQYKHPEEPGLVTLAGKPGDELAPGTLNRVLKQAGLK
jgi:predicted RNA binding protein YcfA (HicA-like mRNA interferase family)